MGKGKGNGRRLKEGKEGKERGGDESVEKRGNGRKGEEEWER